MAKTRVTFKDDRKKFDKLMRDASNINGSYVLVGVNERKGSQKHPGNPKAGRRSSMDATIADVAFWMEFGTGGSRGSKPIPQRPYLRSAFDENKSALETLRNKLLNDVLQGRKSVKTGLDTIGFAMKTFTQNKIKTANSWAKGLSDATIENKSRGALFGSTHPLVDSGTLLNSIDFLTVMK